MGHFQIKSYVMCVKRYNKQLNRDKKLAGYSLRSILAHNFLPVNRALCAQQGVKSGAM